MKGMLDMKFEEYIPKPILEVPYMSALIASRKMIKENRAYCDMLAYELNKTYWDYVKKARTNNWRKRHHIPMKRRGGKRKPFWERPY